MKVYTGVGISLEKNKNIYLLKNNKILKLMKKIEVKSPRMQQIYL